MGEYKMQQLRREYDTWKRSLGFMMEENAHLKGKISDLVKNGINSGFLETLESFQNRFIREDELISVLRDEVKGFEKLLNKETFADGRTIKQAIRKSKQTREHIEIAKEAFSKLQTEFHNYLSQYAPAGIS